MSETLLFPLYALALESRSERPILVDEEAVALRRRAERSSRPRAGRSTGGSREGRLPRLLVTTLALRIRRFDAYVREFLEREPDGVVVNLGCGLDDRRRRVDNGRVRWLDLDLPEVIALRRRLLPESDRMRFVASSALDLSWLELLPDEPGPRFLFVAEGLLMYLPPEGVRELVTSLAARRPGAELVAEVASRRIVRISQGRLGRGKFRRMGLSGDVVYRFRARGRPRDGGLGARARAPRRMELVRRGRAEARLDPPLRPVAPRAPGSVDGPLPARPGSGSVNRGGRAEDRRRMTRCRRSGLGSQPVGRRLHSQLNRSGRGRCRVGSSRWVQ
ncbi:MAG: class I SAM-dependent methyltransferase [Sandaracinaceae bacterium]|nr:class I SAM-dependent methyltransferase [Sandaracinaceae bacterium]